MAQNLNVAPYSEPELAVLGAAEVEAGFSLAEVGGEGGVDGAAEAEEGALEEVACLGVFALLFVDFGDLEEGGDVVGCSVDVSKR